MSEALEELLLRNARLEEATTNAVLSAEAALRSRANAAERPLPVYGAVRNQPEKCRAFAAFTVGKEAAHSLGVRASDALSLSSPQPSRFRPRRLGRSSSSTGRRGSQPRTSTRTRNVTPAPQARLLLSGGRSPAPPRAPTRRRSSTRRALHSSHRRNEHRETRTAGCAACGDRVVSVSMRIRFPCRSSSQLTRSAGSCARA